MRKCYSLAIALLAVVAAFPAYGDPNNTENEGKKWIASRVGILADVAEVEPNNSLATAQFLGCGNTLRPASIAVATPRDTDYISFAANAGDVLTIGTDADGTTGQLGDSRIRLFNNSGVVLASDDDSGPGLYSLISAFVAPYSGTYYVGIAAFSSGTGIYKAFITCQAPQPPPPNDLCSGAIPINCGPINLGGSTQFANNNNNLPTTGSCTRFTAAGKDIVYLLNVAAGDSLWVNYTSTADASIYILTNCLDSTTCVIGEDSTLSNQAETLRYKFPSAGLYYLILDSFGTNSFGTYTAVGELICYVVPSRPLSWGRLKSIYR
jgi:hypothetical protein